MSAKFLTPKAIANKIKAKGLQKLRWYCQMCEKQCRDENGFKCHCLSESHTRQMSLFRDDPSKFMDQYSRDFEGFFMDVMKRKGGMRVRANTVYQEVVADRTHIHMNSTKWESLGVFVQYLGKTGACKVDQTEDGTWYVQYIDRDPRFLARQEEIARRAEMNLDEEERASRMIEKQIEEAMKAQRENKARLRAEAIARGETVPDEDETDEDDDEADEEEPLDLKERGEDEKITFSLAPSTAAVAAAHAPSSSAATAAASSAASTAAASSSAAASAPASSSAPAAAPIAAKPAAPFSMSFARPSMLSAFGGSSGGEESKSESAAAAASGSKRKGPAGMSTLDALMAENERTKAQEQALKKQKSDAAPPVPAAPAASASSSASSVSSSKRLDHWLFPNTIVKILNKKLLGGALYKSKALVLRIDPVDKFVAELQLLPPAAAAQGAPVGTKLKIDQMELETVIPALGKLVQIVNGMYRGEIGVLLELDERNFTAQLRIESGPLRGKEIKGVEYEDICKLNEA